MVDILNVLIRIALVISLVLIWPVLIKLLIIEWRELGRPVVVNNTSPQLQIKSHRRAATPTYAGVAYTEPGARPEIFPDTGLTSEQLTRAVSRMTDTRN